MVTKEYIQYENDGHKATVVHHHQEADHSDKWYSSEFDHLAEQHNGGFE